MVEASTLGGAAGWLARVWSDSCDLGFLVRSPKTGAVLLFTLTSEDKGLRDGETQAWTFTSVEGDIRIVVLND